MPAGGNYYGPPNCNTTLEPTLPEEFVTWNIPVQGKRPSRFGDWTKFHPWRSPGRAPVADPCGVAGAYVRATGGGGETPIGSKQGDLGSELPVNVVTQVRDRLPVAFLPCEAAPGLRWHLEWAQLLFSREMFAH